MFKHFKLAACVLLLSAGFAACSDDDEPDLIIDPTPPNYGPSAYVVNQGNMYGGVSGSMDCIYLMVGNTAPDAFYAANRQSLGDSPQQAVRYGSRIYVPVFGSNLLWVLNASSLQIEAQLRVNEPEAVCGAAGYVFVAGNDGYVTRIDTLTFTPSEPVAVGPNPAGLAASGKEVYVSISDGYNYANGYADGKKVAVIHAESLSLLKYIEVGLNPGALSANSKGEVFVLSRGNYYDVLPKVQKIATDGTVTDYCNGSLFTLSDDCLYVIDAQADYTSNTSSVSLFRINTLTDTRTDIALAAEATPGMPTAIDVEPATGNIYICSDKGPLDYDKTGYVYQLLPTGGLLHRFEVGIHPFGVVFL